MKPRVRIYTDGSCLGNPGAGGWGALLYSGARQRALCGTEPMTTNNRMELTAAIRALEALKRPSQVELNTDSKYLQLGITEWLPRWKLRGWITASRKPVKNRDLWQALEAAVVGHEISWRWIRGHTGNPENEAADRLARGAIPRLDATGPVPGDAP